ncbi:hypothetical protein CYY_002955 [Polysphondylium violaceum]|uniref:TLDc domain-containing protein n=1 Tax=Polysphondylium violaceum TaxID=133409 RepID=A0A8J4PXB9_9MYCE|nr:hypothetical protein CYY_002955 [Polysphondylium violaceum]
MEPLGYNNSSFLLEDNERLQKENWEYKKAGCANKDHIALSTQLQQIKQEIEIIKKENTNNIDELNYTIAQLLEQLDKSNKTIDDLKKSNKEMLKKLKSRIIDKKTFKCLNDWIDSTKRLHFELLYSASDNEFTTSSFHKACDNKGATITVIQTTNGEVFGGYNSTSWSSDGGFGGDSKCFIFTLVSKQGDRVVCQPSKYFYGDLKSQYVYNGEDNGPTFGLKDIVIRDGIDKSYKMFPSSYRDPQHGTTSNTTTPSPYFILKDYEVFKIVYNSKIKVIV